MMHKAEPRRVQDAGVMSDLLWLRGQMAEDADGMEEGAGGGEGRKKREAEEGAGGVQKKARAAEGGEDARMEEQGVV
eukprot:3548146-Rhodomonas_salina.1